MKPFLLTLVLFCFIISVRAQTPKYSIANGEYANFILDNTTQTLYGSGNGATGIGSNNGFIGLPIPCKFPSSNTKIKFVAAGLHTASCIDVNGNVYSTGANEHGSMGNGTTTGGSSSFVQVTTDNLGNPFNNVTYLRMASAIFNGGSGYGAIIFAVKADGTLWVWGNTKGGYAGNGTYGQVYTRPIQVPFPAGTVITKVIVQNVAIALDANGNVWTWAGNGTPDLLGNSSQNDYETPHQISLPSPAIDIAGGGFFSYALLATHSLYGWGWYTGYMGVGPNPGSGVVGMNPPSKPMLLDPSLNLPNPISVLSTNGTSTYVILSDGSLWAWGGNECGQIGNGQEINWKKYTIDPAPYNGAIPEPYNWNQDASTAQLQQHKPIQIAPGLNNFVGLSEGVAAVFYKCAVDNNGQLYSWGRNKNGVLANGVIEGEYVDGLLGATYPNSFDVPYITAINPFAATTNILSTSPECISNPGAGYCNLYRGPANTPPVSEINGTRNGKSNVGNVSSVSLDGTGSVDNVAIVYYIWSEISGPNAPIISIPSGKKVNVLGLKTGTYVFQLKTIDNGWLSDSTKFTLNVNDSASNPPVANAGPNQTIALPTNSVVLTGSGSETNGTISSYQWTQLSGPSNSTILSSTQAQTTAVGLVTGVYTFQLTVTDILGLSATATVQVTVNPFPAGTPSANAGPDQTITLPTNSVSLTGSGTETNGTIVSYLWNQSSGPSTASIATASQANTAVSGLVAGVYTFQLTVTDNSGVKANDVVKITVNAAVVPGAPVANAGSDQTINLPTSSVTLSGSGSETNGSISSYGWSELSGPSTATIGTANLAQTTVSSLIAGVYTFQLTVTDNSGVKATDVTKVTVIAPVLPGTPTANAGADQTITLPINSVSLSGSGTETNGTIVGYQWTQSSGPSIVSIATAGQASTAVNNLIAGVYTFVLTVTDSSGAKATDVVKVTVVAAIVAGAPSASAGADQVITLPTNSVTLTGTGSETNGTIVSYQWTQGSGPSLVTIVSAGQAQTLVTGFVQGVYTFFISVTDSSGVKATDVMKVTVNPAIVVGLPIANAGPDQAITLPTNSVTLSGSGSETNGSIVSYQWTQSSGPSTASIGTSGQALTIVNGLVSGVYTFVLSITDNSGVQATDVTKITVSPAVAIPGLPVVSAGANQTITLPTNSVTLSATASETNGSIVSYRWTQGSGPSIVSINSSDQASTSVGGLVEGVYSFYIAVTDNSGLTATDAVKVTVNAAVVAGLPVVIAAPDQVIIVPASSVTLSCTASETNGTIMSYAWAQTSGPSTVILAAPNQYQTLASGLVQGVYTFTITVVDANGLSANDVEIVTVNAQAIPGTLVVDAGVNQAITLPTNNVTLTATASEVNGNIVSYKWTESSGPSVVAISTPAQAVTSVSGLVVGVYSFVISVTDNSGVTATNSVKVTVSAAVQSGSPIVDPGANQTINLPVSSVILNAIASETNGTIVSYQWTQLSGPSAASIGSPGQAQTTVTSLVQGVYTFQILVTDNSGVTATNVVKITVNSPTVQGTPVVVAGPNQSITLPVNSVTLTGTASETNGSIKTYSWTQVNGPAAASIASPGQAQTVVGSLVAGVYTFQLTVTDSLGVQSTDITKVTVNAASISGLPSVDAGANQTITLPIDSVTLVGTASEVNGTIQSYQWIQISGPIAATIGSPSSAQTGVSALIQGQYTFDLVVIDNSGVSGTATVQITVNASTVNQPPIANAGQNQTIDLAPDSSVIVQLDGSGSYDPDGTIASYQWVQLNGAGGVTIANSSADQASVYGLLPGTYVFQLSVTDNQGATATAQVTINIIQGIGQMPVAVAGNDTSIAFPASSVLLNGSESSDSGGMITQYNWKLVSGPSSAVMANPNGDTTSVSQLVVGDYAFELTVTDNYNHSSTSTVHINVQNTLRAVESINVFPNPFLGNSVNINGVIMGGGKMNVSLFDINGKRVMSSVFENPFDEFQQIVHVPNLASGVYILKIQFAGKSNPYSFKLIRQ
jgi:alpha-tubulin suppressor-like RCC1 family protein